MLIWLNISYFMVILIPLAGAVPVWYLKIFHNILNHWFKKIICMQITDKWCIIWLFMRENYFLCLHKPILVISNDLKSQTFTDIDCVNTVQRLIVTVNEWLECETFWNVRCFACKIMYLINCIPVKFDLS